MGEGGKSRRFSTTIIIIIIIITASRERITKSAAKEQRIHSPSSPLGSRRVAADNRDRDSPVIARGREKGRSKNRPAPIHQDRIHFETVSVGG